MKKFRLPLVAVLGVACAMPFSACSDDSSGLPKENPVVPDPVPESSASDFPASSENTVPLSSEGSLVLSSSSVAPVITSSETAKPQSSSAALSSSAVLPTSSSSAVAPASSASKRTTLPTALPSTVSNPALSVALYDKWKDYHVITLSEEAAKYPVLGKDFSQIFGDYINNGLPVARVIWSSSTDSHCYIDEAQGTNMYKRGCTVSEGVGYGMLISVFREDWETYNGIWNYSKGYRNSKYASGNGLMPWLTNTFSFDIGDQASATDADLDIAASLVIAYYKTGNQEYLADAIKLATAIWDNEVNPANLLIYSGDTPMWKSADPVYNLSYFSPVALRLFAAVDPAHNWTGVLDAMYAYMKMVQDGGTGVFPDWSNTAGVAAKPGNRSADATYWTFNKESVRIPWRIAWDYYWFQDERALAILTKLNTFISGKSGGDPSSNALMVNYSWDPAKNDAASTGTATPSHWLGAWCVTGFGSNPTWVSACTDLFNTRTPANTGSSYFTDILMGIYSALLNGNFVRPF